MKNQPRILRIICISSLLCTILAACGAPAPSNTPNTLQAGPSTTLENPLLEMLGNVPESASQQPGWITYIDYNAALNSRGLTPITDQQAQDKARFMQWGIATVALRDDLLSDPLQIVGLKFAEMRKSVGFTAFDVRQE